MKPEGKLLAVSACIALAGVGAVAYAGQWSHLAPADCPPMESACRAILALGGGMAVVFGGLCIFAVLMGGANPKQPARPAEPRGPFTPAPPKGGT